MKLMNTLLFAVILIEVWHIMYYSFFRAEFFARTSQVVQWAQSYRNMYNSFMKYSNDYANNEELQNIMPQACNPMLDMINALQTEDVKKTTNRIFNIVPMRNLSLFLVQQGIEVLYRIILFMFIFIIPNYGGVYIFIITYMLSWFQKRFNKNNTPSLHITDSVMCIAMYMMFWYFY